MGLFDGGFDMSQLAEMLNPMGSAQAAGGVPPSALPIDRINQGFDASSAQGGEFNNPNPVAAGGVPLPRPNPLQPSPAAIAAANNGAGAVPTGLPGPREDNLGAVLAGNAPSVMPPPAASLAARAPLPGAEGPTAPGATDVSGQAKRPGLAEALKGVVAPKAPELQKISSPNAPRPTGTIKGGDLQALLLALNAGAGNMNRQLPVTLGRG